MRRTLIVIIGTLLIVGCRAAPTPIAPTLPAPDIAVSDEAALLPEATETRIPNTDVPTAQPTDTPAPTATEVPLHPMSIEAMRQQEYPGSQLVFHETLQAGANHHRYYVSYESDGYTIYALLTIPFGDRPATGWPVVIFNHGYIPPEVYKTTERYVAYVNGFADHGYIVLRSDYRGHDQSEGQATGAYSHPGYTNDVLNAVSSIKMYPDADPNRIGMWGHSMGGFITLRAMVVTDDIKAGVIWGGVVSSYPDMMEHWWGPRDRNNGPTNTPFPGGRRRWRDELIAMYGTPEENPEFWASISANSYVADLSGPIQLHHGTADETVPHVLSEILYQEMLDAGVNGDIWLWDGDNHNISNYFSNAMIASIEWFDQYVKGE